MNLPETAQALALAQAFDLRTVGDTDVMAWQSVLSDAAYPDVVNAIKDHYAEHTERIMPAHVRRAVRDMVSQREMAASATPWAPGQYGVLKADAMPEVAGPVDENALTPQVRDLLQSVRAMLPEGSREALMPRTVAWEREHAAFRRQRDAEPNPHYRPVTTCPGGITARRDPDHSNVLRHEDGSFCGHIPVDEAETPKATGGAADGPRHCGSVRCTVYGCTIPGHPARPSVEPVGILPDAYRCTGCVFTTASAEEMEEHMRDTGHLPEGDAA